LSISSRLFILFITSSTCQRTRYSSATLELGKIDGGTVVKTHTHSAIANVFCFGVRPFFLAFSRVGRRA
jgi:hypothetical protein